MIKSIFIGSIIVLGWKIIRLLGSSLYTGLLNIKHKSLIRYSIVAVDDPPLEVRVIEALLEDRLLP